MTGANYDITVLGTTATLKIGSTTVGTFDYAVSDGQIIVFKGTDFGLTILDYQPFSTVPIFSSISVFKTWLDAQPANTAYTVKINVSNLSGDYDDTGSLGNALYTNNNKYVSLDLSGSMFPSIGQSSFYECTGLTSITIPDSVTSIGEEAFWACHSLASVTIGNSVTSIGEKAFWICHSLASVTIGNSVTSIGDGAFYGCTSLTSVTVGNGNTSYTVEGGILYNKAKTKIVHVPSGISGNVTIPNGVTSIGSQAFLSCKSLASVTIPSSVTSIGVEAFFDCISLTNVTFQGKIASDEFGYRLVDNDLRIRTYSPFDGDLHTKYLAGGIGTYTTTAPVGKNSVWTKR
jgi:hypothetical protein